MPILSADLLGTSFETFLAAGGTDAAAASTAADLTAASGVGTGIAGAGAAGIGADMAEGYAADATGAATRSLFPGVDTTTGGVGAGSGSNAAAAAGQIQAEGYAVPETPQANFRTSEIAAQNAGQGALSPYQQLQGAVNDAMQTPFGKGIQAGMDAFDSAATYAEKNPIRSTMAAAYIYNKYQQGHQPAQQGLAPQQPGILADYRFNPNSFNPSRPNPLTSAAQQTMFPVRAAIGGIMQAAPSPMDNTNYPMSHNGYTPYNTSISQTPTPSDVTGINGVQQFKSGDSVVDKAELLNYYESLLSPQTSASSAQPFPNSSLSFSDQGTQGMSPQQAAIYRQNQINKRALMQGPTLNVPTSGTGQVNLTPLIQQKQAEQTAIAAAQGGDESNVESSAHGGIMQAHLGHYAHGGNPRLLKGPGDGMSDNIPATIDSRQPARLATGEFVVPADVVSHMGNGDTDSGAKKLHDWMAKVREARTGNPKQGKEINADKYLPK
jgi:hypothetical protein